MHASQIIIVDLGSQYTQIIARELLRLGYSSIVARSDTLADILKRASPKGIILSGGSSSVYDANAPKIPDELFSLSCPILGICYGMQYMAYHRDNKLVSGNKSQSKEYGPIEIEITESRLFEGLQEKSGKLKVWASHGDIVEAAPKGYRVIARSENAVQAIEDESGMMYAVQFHPEVIETEDDNLILKNFAETICKCQKDWKPNDRITEIKQKALAEIGGGKACIGVSGGVDSTTLAALLSDTLGDRLFAFLIDTGGMRKNEVEEVSITCKNSGIDLHIINAKEKFLEELKNETDAEEKRALFKKVYQNIFKEIIEENKITHVLQGTLATDLIESGQKGHAAKIKSHHNVGLDFGITEVAPFAELFKHEVREIARTLGLPESISERKPFPGPGLYIRVVGVPATGELIEKVREADAIVNDILKKEIFYADISQIVVAILGSKTVGVQGDSRSYNYPVVVRTIASTDFMTVRGLEIPSDIRKKIIHEVTKHGFNRVFFDETPKPPATTELE